jgi:hypothetical protein
LALLLAAMGAAGGFWILERPQDSPGETVAVIRRRPATQAGEDPALAIEQIASQILSPAQMAVLREERSYHEAQAAADQARQAVKQAQQELDRRLDHFTRLAESARAKQADPPEPHSPSAATNTIELPLRAEAVRQLAELEAQRDALLERLLPAHPDVQAIDAEIEAAQARLSQFPREAPANTAPEPAVAVDSLATEVAQAAAAIAEQQRSLSQAGDRARQVSSAERQTAERLLRCTRDRVASISSTAAVAPDRSKPNRQTTFAALSIALVAGWLAGRGRPSPASAFHEPGQLEAAIGVPVVGVLSADDRRSEIGSRRHRPATALS